jgi:cytochrome c biogenesis protein CcmG/thiol:disulfide interchange protein DsbE
MSRYVVPVVAVLLLIPFLMIGLTKDPSKLPSPFLGKPAPSFDLPSLTRAGDRVSNDNFAGEMVLVNIWATWCVGCRQEHAFLNQLARQNFIPIYGINWRDNRQDAQRWLQQLGDPYVDSGFDGDGRVGIDWGAYGAPETFLINAEGIVLYKHLGPLDQRLWQELFMPLIRGQEDSS